MKLKAKLPIPGSLLVIVAAGIFVLAVMLSSNYETKGAKPVQQADLKQTVANQSSKKVEAAEPKKAAQAPSVNPEAAKTPVTGPAHNLIIFIFVSTLSGLLYFCRQNKKEAY